MLAIGVDLGGSFVRAGLVDAARGEIVRAESAALGRTPTERGPRVVAELVAAQVNALGAPPDLPVGVGVASMVTPDGVVVSGPAFPGAWRGVRLRELLAERLGRLPVLANDVDAIAWGEHRHGAGRGVDDLLCVFVGTGIGAGIVAGGRLVLGARGLAGEIGHTQVVFGDAALPCGCGRRGCLEAHASGSALERLGRTDAAVSSAARLFAAQLAAAAALLDPALVVLGGGVWNGSERYRDQALSTWSALTAGREWGAPALVTSALGPGAGILGAADLAVTAAAT